MASLFNHVSILIITGLLVEEPRKIDTPQHGGYDTHDGIQEHLEGDKATDNTVRIDLGDANIVKDKVHHIQRDK